MLSSLLRMEALTMVVNKKQNTTFASTWEIFGESTEDKPTVANGAKEIAPHLSIFVELDTGDAYYYNAETDSWNIIGG